MQIKKLIEQYWARNLVISVVVGGLLGASGAFGTHQLDIFPRVFYWILLIFLGGTIANLTSKLLDRIKLLEERPILYHFVHIFVIVNLITLIVISLNSVFFQVSLSVDAFLDMVPGVFLISVFMTIVHWTASHIPLQSHASNPQIEANSEIKFIERLPFKFKKAQIYAINAEDHYLRVHTSVGETMILMRLYDAIKELEGIEGSQTHRSWWVAKEAINDVVKGDGRVNFRLKNDELAPVSRSFQSALKAQNWL